MSRWKRRPTTIVILVLTPHSGAAPYLQFMASVMGLLDETGRQAYQQAWEERRDRLTQIANNTGCAMIPIDTHSDVHKSLMLGLERRMRLRAYL